MPLMITIAPDIIAAAKLAEKTWKIPASISIAQWALESSWGQRMPAGSNNPFGMKASASQPSVTARTREVDRLGHEYFVEAAFRRFSCIDEAFDAHARLLATDPHYIHARSLLPDADAFADALTRLYATDPTYGKALRAIMHGSDLYRFDQGAVA
jgi:flagellum-specific peptidoglycan hydrolase FlgJ